jgi:hypothetical protein
LLIFNNLFLYMEASNKNNCLFNCLLS